MDITTFVGPFAFFDSAPTIDDIPRGKNGIYLWCVRASDLTYRVYYVGESFDIALRLKDHRKAQMLGQYVAFDPELLRTNIKVLAHRPRKGMVPNYSSHDQTEFNRSFLSAINVFYADLGSEADKSLRCRHEHALYIAVEDNGQNILHVGHLRASTEELFQVQIATPGVNIEALTDAVLLV